MKSSHDTYFSSLLAQNPWLLYLLQVPFASPQEFVYNSSFNQNFLLTLNNLLLFVYNLHLNMKSNFKQIQNTPYSVSSSPAPKFNFSN